MGHPLPRAERGFQHVLRPGRGAALWGCAVSAAYWRRAMNTGTGALPRPVAPSATVVTAPDPYADSSAPRWLQYLWRTLAPRHVFVLLFVLVFPFVATPFLTFQVAAQSLVLGLIALSLTFLGGYGGMVSLAQMTVAGIAGYALAILGTSSTGAALIHLGWPWWVAVPFAVLIATVCATLIGWLSVRTEGIYTIMITLAIGVAFYYLVLQNYTLFNGFQGMREIYPPTVFDIAWRDPIPYYFLSLACALAGYFGVQWVVRTPFGIALQGIRDNPRRMAALGFHVVAHRVAAYALAGLLAAVGGVLLVWYNGLITPGSVSTSWLINILVIAVLGGMGHPIGAFLGAIVFVLLQTFAIDLIDRERFNLVIGGVFFAIVLFSPDGLLGLWARLRSRLGPIQARHPRSAEPTSLPPRRQP
jgi:branched-chain amino acid transport system permease protein